MIHSFSPIVGLQPRVLILGSMPSVKSLEAHQYYGHPRNQFWTIMMDLTGVDRSLAYDERVTFIKQLPVIIWDVLKSCEREGSLDTAIRNEEPNDIQGLLDQHPTLEVIVLNGGKAAQSFKKACPDLVGREDLILLTMPSTSPAYTLPLEEKLKAWRRLIPWL